MVYPPDNNDELKWRILFMVLDIEGGQEITQGRVDGTRESKSSAT